MFNTFYWSALNKCIPCHFFRAFADRNMIDHFTYGIYSTSSWTWIKTFISNTSSISRTFRVKYALWPTAPIRISLIFWQTCTNTIITLSVWTTRRWVAWICFLWLSSWNCKRKEIWWNYIKRNNNSREKPSQILTWSRLGYTIWKWITSKTFRTCTHRYMVDNIANSSNTTWTRARILTFLIYTCQIAGTFRVDSTFWPTVRWWTKIWWEAWARGCSTNIFTLRIWSTWGGQAWIYNSWLRWCRSS